IVRRSTSSQMRETIGEARPAVDFREQLGDAQTRQHGVEAANDRVGLLVLRLANRTDRQAFLGERGFGQFPGSGESVNLAKARLQTFGLFVVPVLETIGDGTAMTRPRRPPPRGRRSAPRPPKARRAARAPRNSRARGGSREKSIPPSA